MRWLQLTVLGPDPARRLAPPTAGVTLRDPKQFWFFWNTSSDPIARSCSVADITAPSRPTARAWPILGKSISRDVLPKKWTWRLQVYGILEISICHVIIQSNLPYFNIEKAWQAIPFHTSNVFLTHTHKEWPVSYRAFSWSLRHCI